MARKSPRTARFENQLQILESKPSVDLRPALEGFAYRFTIYLPLLSQGRPVYREEQCAALAQLFFRRFGGYTATLVEGNPPWYGAWLPPGASEPIVDRHTLFVIYASQREEAKTFFRYLKSILELTEVAEQDVVVIEQVSVWLVEGGLLPPPN